jgi:hypothetical protein
LTYFRELRKVELQLPRILIPRTTVNKGKNKASTFCEMVLRILTATHGNAGARRSNATRGAISDEVRGVGISSGLVAFSAVISRHREASEEDVGVVALGMLAQPISEKASRTNFGELTFQALG